MLLLDIFLIFTEYSKGVSSNTSGYVDGASRNSVTGVEAPEIEDKAFMDGLVTVEKVGRYAGIFVEDGSDEIVSDVFAITVHALLFCSP